MVLKTAEHPFRFTGCPEIWEILGRSARDERQLLEGIEEIHFESIS